MNWRKYEKEIYDAFKDAYPELKISFDQLVKGRYSLIDRQVDILAEGYMLDEKIQIAIDGKYYSEKVDVKAVESFISMMADINVAKGILITQKGYSQAAINRAYNDPLKIELDILNFHELIGYQAGGGMIHQGPYGAMIGPPFGWVLDAEQRGFSLANLYQRGKTFKEAVESLEWMYASIFVYEEGVENIEKVMEYHENNALIEKPNLSISRIEDIERKDGKKTIIRKILQPGSPTEEYTGYVDFDGFCVFLVFYTPPELRDKNIRKLNYVMNRLLPIHKNMESHAATEIASRERLLENSEDPYEKAGILNSIAEIHKDMGDHENAVKFYAKSDKLIQDNYVARPGLLEIGFRSSERNQLLDSFFSLDPTSPTICSNIVSIGFERKEVKFIEDYLLLKLKEFENNIEIIGNLQFSLADLYLNSDQLAKAEEFFNASKSSFLLIDVNHKAINAIENAIETITQINHQ